MRRTLALCAVVLTAAVVLVPLPANAADPLPPPVVEVPDLPSRAPLYAPTSGGTLANKTAADYWKVMSLIQRGMAANGTVGVPVSINNVPKPITPASTVLARGGAAASGLAGGTAVVGFQAGWAFGQGTLQLIAASNSGNDLGGATYGDLICGSPGWYQAINSTLMLGAAPDCKAMYSASAVNADQVMTGTLSYNGGAGGWLGPDIFSGSGATIQSQWRGCFANAYYANGANVVWQYATGATTINNFSAGSPYGPGMTAFTGCPTGTTYGVARVQGTTGVIGVKVMNGSTTLASSVGVRADKTRTPRCRLTWPDGSITTTLGTPYRETLGIPLSSDGLGCKKGYSDYVSQPGRGPGLLPSRIQIESDDGSVITQIADTPVPSESDGQKSARTTTGNGRGLVLEKVVNGFPKSCLTWEVSCVDWWTQTSQGTTPGTGSNLYRCTFAGADVALTECGVYRHTFDVQTSTPTITDPTTGTDVGWDTGPATGGEPSTGTGTGTFPSTGTNPSTGASPDTGGGGCTAGWSWNPVDWVVNPLKCVMIPSAASVAAAQTAIQGHVDGSIIGTVGSGITTLGEAFDAGVGCGGLPFHLEGPGWEVDHMLLASCDEPAAGIAATVRTILTVAIIGGGILAFMRYAGALFGFAAFGKNRTDSGGKGGPSFD